MSPQSSLADDSALYVDAMDERVVLKARIDALLDHIISITSKLDIQQEVNAWLEHQLQECRDAKPEV